MDGITLLQFFILVQVFIMGGLAVLAARYAYAHFRPPPPVPKLIVPSPSADYLPPAVKDRLLHASQAQFQSILKHSAAQLEQELQSSGVEINQLVNKLANEIIAGEMERYRLELDRLRNQASAELGGISDEVAKHEAELKAKLTQEIEAEKQKLVKLIDAKLADAVGSFLLETLGHNVDLGSQNTYLVAMLEEHKADFVKELGSGTEPAR